MTSSSVEQYILEKVPSGGTLRPSEFYALAREEDAPFTEQDLRRKIWTLVNRGSLELTSRMSLRHSAHAGLEKQGRAG